MGRTSNLAGILLTSASERGWDHRVALREPGRALTYGELGDQVGRLAAVLSSIRVKRGERVAVLMPDSLEAAVAILGAIHLGAVSVPLSELSTPTEVRDRMVSCGAVCAIVHEGLRNVIEPIRLEVPTLREILCVGATHPGERDFLQLMQAATPASAPARVKSEEPALILYSAGALEGADHGVPHSHRTPLAAHESCSRDVLELGPDDRVFSVIRLSTEYGLSTGFLGPLLSGAEAMLLPRQPRSDAVFAVIDRFAPTVFVATPSVYGQLARDAEAAGIERPLGKVRAAVSSAEGMPAKLMRRTREILGVEVIVAYCLTETYQFVLASRPGEAKPGSCGRSLSGFETRIVDDEGGEVGFDEIGTLEVRGPTVAEAYWSTDSKRADRPPMRAPDGWYRTSDRFLVDDEGHFFHCGRVDGQFKVGGKWVSPTEVEQALLGHAAVWECAVIGVDDVDGLIKPIAFVVPNIGHEPDQALADELRAHVKSELAPYKYPRWIEFVEELPKGPAGKILRYKLRAPPGVQRRSASASE